MNALLRTGLVILFLGILTSCATPSAIVPNTTTADELLKKLGSPTDKRANPAGGEFWEYATGPEGTQTWLFWIDSGRMVRSSTQLLTEERLRQIVPGKTTEAEVRAFAPDANASPDSAHTYNPVYYIIGRNQSTRIAPPADCPLGHRESHREAGRMLMLGRKESPRV